MPGKKRLSKAAQAAARRLDNWMRQVDADQFARAEALPLRRDMVTLLTYVCDNRVTGTQSTGNLPLKAVREVIARFVHPLEMETTIGDRTFEKLDALEVEDVWDRVGPTHYSPSRADIASSRSGRCRPSVYVELLLVCGNVRERR
jgi:hypothetical protein